MATEIQLSSPKAKEVLQRNAELRQGDSKFIKLEPNERKMLQFDLEKIEQKEEEFNGKKIQRYYYNERANSKQEKYLTVRLQHELQYLQCLHYIHYIHYLYQAKIKHKTRKKLLEILQRVET